MSELERLTLVESIFLQALDLALEERDAFLNDSCEGDEPLRQRVTSLLAHAATGSGDAATTLFRKSAGLTLLTTQCEALPIPIGRYELHRRIGEGSFGVVYQASQRVPVRREVAIKVMRPGMQSREVAERFNVERQALAALDHANIARLIDAGAMPDGRPYFVMELLEGESLTSYCDSRALPIRDRLNLFLDVCAAVEHAHRRAILHRDLKPSNILVRRSESGAADVKVIDFGIARLLGDAPSPNSFATEAGRMIGTPEYMSPELAMSETNRVDTRSDVYALGVVLFELLCGRLPFGSQDLRASALQMQRLICHAPPPSPSRAWANDHAGLAAASAARSTTPAVLQTILRQELEWIPLKAIRKDAAERYESVAALADDIRAYLTGLPLRAARHTHAYFLRKFISRHRKSVAIGSVAAISILAALVASILLLHRARQAESGARASERNANITSAMLRVEQGNALISVGRFGPAREQFERARVELSNLSGPSWIADLALVDLARNAAPPMLEWQISSSRLANIHFLPDSRHAVIATSDGDVLLTDVSTCAVKLRHHVDNARWVSTKLAEDANCLVLSDESRRLFRWTLDSTPPALVRSDLGDLLAVDASGTHTLHADPEGVSLCNLSDSTLRKYVNEGAATRAQFIPGERFVACGKYGFNTCVWSTTGSATPLAKIKTDDWCMALAVSPDGRVAAVGGGHVVHMLDLQAGVETGLLRGHDELITALVWDPTPHSERFYSCSWDGSCRVWNIRGEKSDVFQGPSQPLEALSVAPDGSRIIAAGWDGKLYAWSAEKSPALLDVAHRQPIKWPLLATLLCDDLILAVGEGVTPVVLYDRITGMRLGDMGPESHTCGLISGVTSTEIGFESRGALAIHDLVTGNRVATLGETVSADAPRQPVYIWRATTAPRAAVWRRGKDLAVWDIASRKLIRTLSTSPDLTQCVSISPDGRLVMVQHDEQTNGLELFEVDFPGRSWRVPGSQWAEDPIATAISGDGAFVLTRRRHTESFAKMWRVADRAFVGTIPNGSGVITKDTFWPDDQHLLSTLEFGDAVLRSCSTGETLYTLHEVGSILAVSGMRALVTSQQWNSHVRVFDLEWPARRRSAETATRIALARAGSGHATPQDLQVLGQWFALHGENKWAVEYLTSARQRGANVDPLDLATAYIRLGNRPAAADEYERALRTGSFTQAQAAYFRLCLLALRGTPTE